MRNRILSLVLVVALTMSLFVVGASATSFADAKDIVNKDAVEQMGFLNIIKGRDNGKFDPKGIVTRAELCKMICIALNGGNDPKLSSSSIVAATFADTKGHWAEGYIEYCVNIGIVAGMGEKTFAPDQTVTSSQAAKMLLVALGYDPAFEKLTGQTWELDANKLAVKKDLYHNVIGIDPKNPLTRDTAAQMIYNFCNASLVKYEANFTETGAVIGEKWAKDLDQNLLSKYYKMKSVSGTINKIIYDSSKKEYGYLIGSTTYYTEADYADLFGMKVTLFYKDKVQNNEYNHSEDFVYYINADGSKLMAEGYTGDFSSSGYSATNQEISFNGLKYQTDASTVPSIYFVDGTVGTAYAGNASALVPSGYECAKIRLLDVDNNKKVDKLVITPFNLEQVTDAGTHNVTVTGTTANKKLVDVATYQSMAQNDQVCVLDAKYSSTGKITFEKATIDSAKVSEIKNGECKLGDRWYSNRSGVKLELNDTIEYVAFGGVIFYAKAIKI